MVCVGSAMAASSTFTPSIYSVAENVDTLSGNNVYTLTIGGNGAGTGAASTPTPTLTGGSNFGNGTVRNLRTNMTYDTIQWGIDNATGGDTLVASATNYNEHILVDRTLTIRAAPGANKPVIDGKGASRVVDIEANDVVLDGFFVRGSSADGYGIYGHGSGITVKNCQVTYNGYGIYFDGAGNVVVQSCSITQNSYGITLDDTKNSKISGCTVSSNDNYGNSLQDVSNKNQIDNNVVANNGGAGIEVTESDSNVIIYNELHDNGAYGVTMHCQFNLVCLNTFRQNSPANAFYDPGTEPDNNLWHSAGPVKYTYNGVEYTRVVGNFWDTFQGPDSNKDGVSEKVFTNNKIVDTNPLVVDSREILNVKIPRTSTEGTSANWTWLLLLALIPLAGIVIYYFAFMREK